jgi:glycerate kinase
MKKAVENGAKHIILGLGGSATNDGGCGAAAAMGVRFLDADGKEFVPVGSTLKDICSIDMSEAKELLKNVSVTIMCDIENPLCGPTGAAAVFGPQKGADEAMVRLLDDGLMNLSKVISKDLGIEVADLPGAGAAGGMGAGAAAFFGGKLIRGIDVVLEAAHFDEKLHDASVVFSGEGSFDSQSFMGKVVSGVASRAKTMDVPVVIVAGSVNPEVSRKKMLESGIHAAFSINRQALPFEKAAPKSAENLRSTMENIMRLLKLRITE